MAEIRVGTSAFTAAGWEGTFYPKGLPAREQLSYYATQFDAVELFWEEWKKVDSK